MSNASLASILSSLPESSQHKAITAYLHELLTSARWEEADAVWQKMSAVRGHTALKADAAGICLLICLRRRNLPAALGLYQYICGLAANSATLRCRADALFHLAGSLLPGQPSKLLTLWRQARKRELPPHAQKLFAHIGLLLLRQFLKNSDAANAAYTLRHLRAAFSGTKCHAAVAEAQKIFQRAL